MFVQKMCAFNIDEIDAWCQFHQRFTHAFFVQNFGAKNYKALFLALRLFGAKILYEKSRV